MTAYPDTSFICSLYQMRDTSIAAIEFKGNYLGPLPVSSFLLLEFKQSIRFQIWLREKDQTKGFSESEGTAMLRALQSDLTAGVYEMVSPDWADVHRIADGLSSKYTGTHGHRLADILHVATAVHLGAEQFLTFDGKQKRLAEAEGMKVPA